MIATKKEADKAKAVEKRLVTEVNYQSRMAKNLREEGCHIFASFAEGELMKALRELKAFKQLNQGLLDY